MAPDSWAEGGDAPLGHPRPPRSGTPGEPGVPLDLPSWLSRQRWFAGKARPIRSAVGRDRVRLGPGTLYVVFVGFADNAAELERYLVALRSGERAVDAFDDPSFCHALLDVVRGSAEVEGDRGMLIGRPPPA